MVNREWRDLDDKLNLLENGRITSFSVSVENNLGTYRSVGSPTYRAVQTSPQTTSFEISGHIISQGQFIKSSLKSTKRKYKKKEYEILVKHKDGHFTQQTLTVPRNRIGKIPKKLRQKKQKNE